MHFYRPRMKYEGGKYLYLEMSVFRHPGLGGGVFTLARSKTGGGTPIFTDRDTLTFLTGGYPHLADEGTPLVGTPVAGLGGTPLPVLSRGRG